HITEAAEGNPLYLEQMAAMLAEGGPTHAIPPTIQALIAARLDRLPAEERAVLESAAVAGKHFVRSALRKLLAETDQTTVDASLLSLARKDLLAARPGREDAYRFRHVLIRDAAYAGIPKELRARLHERFADWAANTGAGGDPRLRGVRRRPRARAGVAPPRQRARRAGPVRSLRRGVREGVAPRAARRHGPRGVTRRRSPLHEPPARTDARRCRDRARA